MGSDTLDRLTEANIISLPQQRRTPSRTRGPVLEPIPDEPLAVVALGARGSGRSDVIAALVGAVGRLLDVPKASYLVVNHGHGKDVCSYLPGARKAHPFRSLSAPADESAAARPPRRIELSLPDPLLRHFALVDAPDTEDLGVAGGRVLHDAVQRGGAVMYVLSAGQLPGRFELDILGEVAQTNAAVFFVVTPRADGTWYAPATALSASDVDLLDLGEIAPGLGDNDPAAGAVEAQRLAIATAIPALAEVPWFAVDPAAGDTAFLRRALIEWAADEGMRRASDNPPVPPNAMRTVRVAEGVHESDWAERLEAAARAETHLVRQRLAIELANIHLRCVQEIVFGAGPSGLPEVLDREMHALSLKAVAECDDAVDRLLTTAATQVLGAPPDEGVRRRVAAGVRRGLADDRAARDLDKVLLITSTAGVATVAGGGAVAGLAAYPVEPGRTILPSLGVGLAGGCYGQWRNAGPSDTNRARSWAQRSIRGVELELLREVSRRLDATHRALSGVLAEAVDHGILLA
ncbi:hypothetical protein [Asanoa siamensis]|uniref:Dynamin family protein n=1 Tax=Asanoa siamensis TaxID=926357 RepID=A0ABQ4CPL0_9ACTN|nr:hypothetical protein [Asanoa siamensis]GIF73232.1 hypothetical protein Asi02nite_27500 [Asanoa siamensis]